MFGTVLPFAAAVPLTFWVTSSHDYTTTNFAAMYLFLSFCLYLPALAVLGRILAERRLIQTQLGVVFAFVVCVSVCGVCGAIFIVNFFCVQKTGVLALSTSALETMIGLIMFAAVLSVGGGKRERRD